MWPNKFYVFWIFLKIDKLFYVFQVTARIYLVCLEKDLCEFQTSIEGFPFPSPPIDHGSARRRRSVGVMWFMSTCAKFACVHVINRYDYNCEPYHFISTCVRVCECSVGYWPIVSITQLKNQFDWKQVNTATRAAQPEHHRNQQTHWHWHPQTSLERERVRCSWGLPFRRWVDPLSSIIGNSTYIQNHVDDACLSDLQLDRHASKSLRIIHSFITVNRFQLILILLKLLICLHV